MRLVFIWRPRSEGCLFVARCVTYAGAYIHHRLSDVIFPNPSCSNSLNQYYNHILEPFPAQLGSSTHLGDVEISEPHSMRLKYRFNCHGPPPPLSAELPAKKTDKNLQSFRSVKTLHIWSQILPTRIQGIWILVGVVPAQHSTSRPTTIGSRAISKNIPVLFRLSSLRSHRLRGRFEPWWNGSMRRASLRRLRSS
jgi:hypothetical protein